MLDIYYFEVFTEEIIESPDENKYLASINIDQHKSLEKIFKKCSEAGVDFSYFQDSLLLQDDVRKMNNIFEKNRHLLCDNKLGIDSYNMLLNIFTAALSHNGGLITYCD